jgi:hypothetical protein
MPIGSARRIATNKVNLKTRKKSGIRTTHKISVRHPVAKSFASIIWHPFLSILHDKHQKCIRLQPTVDSITNSGMKKRELEVIRITPWGGSLFSE